MIEPTQEERLALAHLAQQRDGEIVLGFLNRAIEEINDSLSEPPYDETHTARCGGVRELKEFRTMLKEAPEVARSLQGQNVSGGIPPS